MSFTLVYSSQWQAQSSSRMRNLGSRKLSTIIPTSGRGRGGGGGAAERRGNGTIARAIYH